MRIISLASGSRGNATVVEHDGATLLIDCGLTCKSLLARFSEASGACAGRSAPGPLAVLLTHSHADHTAGLRPLLGKRPELAVYANAMTAETVMSECRLDGDAFACFENAQPFDVGPFEVVAFSIPHDTSDPVGYLVRAGGVTYFHGTDIGTPLDSIGEMLAEADCATLESNHDPALLYACGRPRSVIQRIAGPRGHLSNDQSAELVRRFASPKLKRLGLAHLSRDCNVPHVAEDTMRATLAEMRRADISLRVYSQDSVVEL